MIELILFSFAGGAALAYIIWYLANALARYYE
jgi:surfactin synthase thioesterase subunit